MAINAKQKLVQSTSPYYIILSSVRKQLHRAETLNANIETKVLIDLIITK